MSRDRATKQQKRRRRENTRRTRTDGKARLNAYTKTVGRLLAAARRARVKATLRRVQRAVADPDEPVRVVGTATDPGETTRH